MFDCDSPRAVPRCFRVLLRTSTITLASAAAIVALCAPALASTYTWTGTTGNGNWGTVLGGTITNWTPNSIPPSTADVSFTSITGVPNVNLQIARTVNSVTLGSLQNYDLTGGSLTITSGTVTINSTVSPTTQTLDTPITLGATGQFSISSPATLAVTQPITDGSNPYGLNVGGTGTLSLQSTGNSVFTLTSSGGGLIDVNGGSINVRDTDGSQYDTSLASSITFHNGGKFTSVVGSNFQINGGASNTLTVDGATSSLTGLNLLTIGNSGTPGSLHVSNGASISNVSALTVAGLDTGGLVCVATIDSGATISTGSGSLGAVANSLGTVTVTGANSLWHVNNTMSIGGFNDGQFGGTGTLIVSNGGQVQTDGDTKFYTATSSLTIDKATYNTSILETASGVTPTIKVTDPSPSGTHALTLNNTNLSSTPNFAGTIIDSPDGPGSVIKTGGATQALSGHNTYTNGTFVNGGTLQLGIEDALASTGPVTLSGGTLDIGTHTEHVGSVTLTSGTISGSTGATLIGSNMTLSAGSISVPFSTTGAITKATSGTVTDTAPISATTLTVNAGTLDAQGGIQALIVLHGSAQLKARGTISGGSSTVSTSTVTLTGNTTFSGATSLSGTLEVGSQTASFATGNVPQIGTATIAGGLISSPDGYQLSTGISGYGTVSSAITSSNTSGQSISASGGTLSIGTFAAADSLSAYTGSLAANALALNLFSSGFTTLGSSATLTGGSINSINGVRVKSGKSLSGYGAITGPLDNQGTVAGGSGSNFLHLTDAVTGIGAFQQNISFESSYSPGDGIASVSFSGNTVFAPTSLLKVELSGTGLSHDHITDTGSLTLGGTLNVSLLGGFIPGAGQSFDLLDFDPANTTGTFATLQLPALTAGLYWNTTRLYTDGVLSIGLQGDYDGNGVVDAADYVVYRHTLGQIGTALAADGNANGVIDPGDFDFWRAHFAHTNGISSSLGGTAAPEPATLLMLVIVSIAGWVRRSDRSHHRN